MRTQLNWSQFFVLILYLILLCRICGVTGFFKSHIRYIDTSVRNLSSLSARVMYDHRAHHVSSIPVLTTLCDQSPTAAVRVPPGFTRFSIFSFVVLNSTCTLPKVFHNSFWALSRFSHLCHSTLVSFSKIPPACMFLRRSTIGIYYFMSP
jgi:hypothetical protein